MKNKLYLSLLFLFLCSLLFSAHAEAEDTLLESKVISGNKIDFFQLARENEIESPYILSLRDAKTQKELHRHTLEEAFMDCNSISVELGTYKIFKKEIIFYSYWGYAGDTPTSVYGFRKQVYGWNKKKGLFQKSAIISISPASLGYGGDALIATQAALDAKNPTEKQKKIFTEGLENIRSIYQADLIPTTQVPALEKEVRSILKDKIAIHTKGWEEDTIMKKFGVQK